MNKKVAIIGSVGIPANYGGFETLTEHLVNHLHRQYDITVYCSGKKYPKAERLSRYKSAKLKFIPLDANGIQSIPYDTWSIIHALFYADILLILGVAGAWILPLVRIFTNKKIIISIDGIEWKRAKWNFIAKWYLAWAEKMAVKYSHIDISDNESIQDYTAQRYKSLSRIIEYGADHTLDVKPTAEDRVEFPFLSKPYAFKVCRIEPENHVHEVLEAFAQLRKFKIVMVGNWERSEYGLAVRAKYGDLPNITLLNPIYDQRKLDVLRGSAILYIHGHSAGGTNPSLVEAMYMGLPVMTNGVSYNRTTTEGKALYFNNHKDLIALIQNTSLDELKAIGTTMKEIAHRRYTWKVIAEKYRALIEEVLVVRQKGYVAPIHRQLDESNLISMNAAHLKHQRLFFER